MLRKIAIVGLLALSLTGCGSFNDRTVTIHVTDKERVCDGGNGNCKYLIYTDQGTFKDVDSYLNGKFNSSDIYGQIKRDHTYVVHAEGYRAGFLSSYPNIVEIKSEVK